MIKLKFIRSGIPLGPSFPGFDGRINLSMLDLTSCQACVSLDSAND